MFKYNNSVFVTKVYIDCSCAYVCVNICVVVCICICMCVCAVNIPQLKTRNVQRTKAAQFCALTKKAIATSFARLQTHTRRHFYTQPHVLALRKQIVSKTTTIT